MREIWRPSSWTMAGRKGGEGDMAPLYLDNGK